MSDPFDAIVIGSGIGGLTAGALLANAGRRVLVLERNEQLGGAATTLRRGKLLIDASLHEMDGLDRGDQKTAVFDELGLWDRVAAVTIPELHEVRSPLLGEPFVLPCGLESAKAAAGERFPSQRSKIAEFLDQLSDIRIAITELSKQETGSNWLPAAIANPTRFWSLVRHRDAVTADVLDRYFGDDEAVKLALAPNMSYFTDNPAHLWFPGFAVAQASYLIGGAHYIRGGSGALSNALVALIEARGGQARPGRHVTRILLDASGRAAGVVHQSSHGGSAEEAHAPIILGNAAPQALAQMLPEARQGEFLAPYAKRPLSHSLFSLYLGLRERPAQFGLTRYSTFLYPAWMESARKLPVNTTLLGAEPGKRMPVVSLANYDAIDSGLAVEGVYALSIVGLDSARNWRGLSDADYAARRQRWTDRLIEEADRHYPGLAQAVVYKELATARTIQDYLHTPDGAVYGFAAVPPRGDSSHLGDPRTPIMGLYLASSYVWYGGLTGAILGGFTAARAVLGAAAQLQATR